MSARTFLINRKDLSDVQWADAPTSDLAEGEIRFSVDEFALTANNITYAVAGETMNYWDFFPTQEGYGQLPVWGFGTVTESRHSDVAVGERCYGYFPLATSLTVVAGRVTPNGITDTADHRAPLAVVYNQYQRTAAESTPEQRATEMLYRPLFMTSFMLDDYVADADGFGARQIILTSASSKTSIGLASLLYQRDGYEVVGLTSSGNRAFVEGLGCYHRVLSYHEISQLDAAVPAVSVDMAGNGETLAALHSHFQDNLKQSVLVGATHWSARSGAGELAGPKPELFFAPSHIARRTKEWGQDGLNERFGGAWAQFTERAGAWIEVSRQSGEAAIEAVYQEQLAGTAPASKGYVLSP